MAPSWLAPPGAQPARTVGALVAVACSPCGRVPRVPVASVDVAVLFASKGRTLAAERDNGELTRWTIHGERVVDDTRRMRLSIASVELPDGVQFEQYVFRMPKAAMMIVIDDNDRALMMWRHRFIIDRWVWELPGG